MKWKDVALGWCLAWLLAILILAHAKRIDITSEVAEESPVLHSIGFTHTCFTYRDSISCVRNDR